MLLVGAGALGVVAAIYAVVTRSGSIAKSVNSLGLPSPLLPLITVTIPSTVNATVCLFQTGEEGGGLSCASDVVVGIVGVCLLLAPMFALVAVALIIPKHLTVVKCYPHDNVKYRSRVVSMIMLAFRRRYKWQSCCLPGRKLEGNCCLPDRERLLDEQKGGYSIPVEHSLGEQQGGVLERYDDVEMKPASLSKQSEEEDDITSRQQLSSSSQQAKLPDGPVLVEQLCSSAQQDDRPAYHALVWKRMTTVNFVRVHRAVVSLCGHLHSHHRGACHFAQSHTRSLPIEWSTSASSLRWTICPVCLHSSIHHHIFVHEFPLQHLVQLHRSWVSSSVLVFIHRSGC